MLVGLEHYKRLCPLLRNSKKEYNNSPAVVFEGMILFHKNFQGLLINLSPIKPEILMSKTPLVAEKLLFVR